MQKPTLSIVIPCHNEQENITLLEEAFSSISDKLPSFEIIFVDDASTDKTVNAIRDLKAKKLKYEIKLVRLSRNFGHQLALLAGMQNAQGEACVSIDADLQDPPEVIVEMVKKWREGIDVVLGQRVDRAEDTFFKRLTAKLFYQCMSYLTKGQFPEQVGDFRLISRKVLDVVLKFRDVNPYWRGLVVWVGYSKALVPYRRVQRQFGETKYPFWKMLSLALDAIFAFSKRPLQIASWIGFSISVLSFVYGIVYICLRLAGYSDLVPGWTSLASVITLLGGLQLVCLGILGQYVGRIYEQTLERPLVVVDQVESIV